MNSYELTALRKPHGLLITGHIGGTPQLQGVPALESLPSPTADTLVFKLIFRPFTDHHGTAFDHLIRQPPSSLRMIRILLPDFQEFIIHSQAANIPFHPVPRTVSNY